MCFNLGDVRDTQGTAEELQVFKKRIRTFEAGSIRKKFAERVMSETNQPLIIFPVLGRKEY